jgi:hypothetical protein
LLAYLTGCGDVSEKPCEPGAACRPDAARPADDAADPPDARVSDLQLQAGQITTAGPSAAVAAGLSLIERGFEHGAATCMNQLCVNGGIAP